MRNGTFARTAVTLLSIGISTITAQAAPPAVINTSITRAQIVARPKRVRVRPVDVRQDQGCGAAAAPQAAFPGGGYLVFRNSWGTGFMDGGYGYMSFDYANKYTNDLLEYVKP